MMHLYCYCILLFVVVDHSGPLAENSKSCTTSGLPILFPERFRPVRYLFIQFSSPKLEQIIIINQIIIWLIRLTSGVGAKTWMVTLQKQGGGLGVVSFCVTCLLCGKHECRLHSFFFFHRWCIIYPISRKKGIVQGQDKPLNTMIKFQNKCIELMLFSEVNCNLIKSCQLLNIAHVFAQGRNRVPASFQVGINFSSNTHRKVICVCINRYIIIYLTFR